MEKNRSAEIEKVNQAIKDCKARGISSYIMLEGKPYLVTSDGIMLYEGSTTVAYSESEQYRKIKKSQEQKSG